MHACLYPPLLPYSAPPRSPEPAGVCHICDGPLLEQLSAPSSLKLKFPPRTSLSLPFPHGSRFNKCPLAQPHRSIPGAHKCGG